MADKNIRLIDANEIANGINQYFCNVCSSLDGERCRDCEINEVLRLIDNTPTVEAEPVKHGRWLNRIQKDGTTIGQHNVKYCSECGYVIFTKVDNYCPSCGTRMDGDKND